MLKIGLDLGTGFVKCVSNYCSVRFPSLYVRRTHGDWASVAGREAVGDKALRMLRTAGTATIRPIVRGRPDPRYQKQVEMLVRESVDRIRIGAGREADGGDSHELRIAVGLPYEASDYRDSIAKIVRRAVGTAAGEYAVVAQAVGTLVDLGMSSGLVVSVGQGTTEIVVIDDNEVIDGESSGWASSFITAKVGKFAHLDTDLLLRRRDTCKKYAKVLAENLATEIADKAAEYGNSYDVALSGGGLFIPGVRDELESRLKQFRIMVPDDPVMSNAAGLYKLVE